MTKIKGALSIEMAIICLLTVALAISLLGVIKDAYYDELAAGHRINSHAVLVMIEGIYGDMCFLQNQDDENGITDGDSFPLCNGSGFTLVDFSSNGYFEFTPLNENYGLGAVD